MRSQPQPSDPHPPVLAPKRPPGWRRALAALGATAVAAAGCLVAAAAPAHALDTAFTTVNQSGENLVLVNAPKGTFAVRPTSLADGASGTWRVVFRLGADNWADVHYAIGTTGYRLWLSANPAYGSFPAELRCTIRDASGRIVTRTPQGYACAVSSTRVVLTSDPMTRFTTVNRTAEPLTLSATPRGAFWTRPASVAPYATGAWQVMAARGADDWAEVRYAIGSTGYQLWLAADPASAGRPAALQCTIRDASGTIVDVADGLGCVVSGTQVAVSLDPPTTFTTANQTYLPVTVAALSGGFAATPGAVPSETAGRWSVMRLTNGTYASRVVYQVGTSGYRAVVRTSADRATCDVVDAQGTPVPTNPMGLVCQVVLGTTVRLSVPSVEVANATSVAVRPSTTAGTAWSPLPDARGQFAAYADGVSRLFYPVLQDPSSADPRLTFTVGRGQYVAVVDQFRSATRRCTVSRSGQPTTDLACQATPRGFRLAPTLQPVRVTLDNRTSSELRTGSRAGDATGKWLDYSSTLGALGRPSSRGLVTFLPGEAGSVAYRSSDGGQVRLSWSADPTPVLTCTAPATSPVTCQVGGSTVSLFPRRAS